MPVFSHWSITSWSAPGPDQAAGTAVRESEDFSTVAATGQVGALVRHGNETAEHTRDGRVADHKHIACIVAVGKLIGSVQRGFRTLGNPHESADIVADADHLARVVATEGPDRIAARRARACETADTACTRPRRRRRRYRQRYPC